MKKINIRTFVRKDIKAIKGYIPGTSAQDLSAFYNLDPKDVIKLNANENPYGYSPNVLKGITNPWYKFYPPSDYKNLRSAIAKYIQAKPEQIAVGSGSDELIDLFFRIIIDTNDAIINCPPTFPMYDDFIKLNKGKVINILRKKDFSIDIEKIIKAAKQKNVKAIVLCNPNNPTGNLILNNDIEKILETGKIVIVDEAYYEFSKQTSLPLLNKYPNLVIFRTFSKWAGLAGFRVGYGIMDPFFIKNILRLKLPFNVNVVGESAAIATLQDLSFAKECIKKIVSERERMYKKLSILKSITIYQSYGNFLLIQIKNGIYEKIKKTFDKNKISLRYVDTPLIQKSIRITIGTPVQNTTIIKILTEAQI